MCALTLQDPEVRESTSERLFRVTRASQAGRSCTGAGPGFLGSGQATERNLEWELEKERRPLCLDPEWEQGERGDPWAKAVTQKTRAKVKTDAEQKLSMSGGTQGLP